MSQLSSGQPQWFQLSRKAIASRLAAVPLFDGVPPAELNALAEHCRCARYERMACIYRRGGRADYLCIVYSGAVAMFVGYDGSVDLIMKIRKRNDYFGELGILSGKTQPCNAVAQEETALILIPAEEFMDFAWMHRSVLERLMGELTDRLVMSSYKLINTIYMDAAGKLAFTIIRLLSCTDGENCEISISQSDLARSSGLARQTVVKLLAEWRETGWVSTRRKRLIIHNREALMDIVLYNESNQIG